MVDTVYDSAALDETEYCRDEGCDVDERRREHDGHGDVEQRASEDEQGPYDKSVKKITHIILNFFVLYK